MGCQTRQYGQWFHTLRLGLNVHADPDTTSWNLLLGQWLEDVCSASRIYIYIFRIRIHGNSDKNKDFASLIVDDASNQHRFFGSTLCAQFESGLFVCRPYPYHVWCLCLAFSVTHTHHVSSFLIKIGVPLLSGWPIYCCQLLSCFYDPGAW